MYVGEADEKTNKKLSLIVAWSSSVSISCSKVVLAIWFVVFFIAVTPGVLADNKATASSRKGPSRFNPRKCFSFPEAHAQYNSDYTCSKPDIKSGMASPDIYSPSAQLSATELHIKTAF